MNVNQRNYIGSLWLLLMLGLLGCTAGENLGAVSSTVLPTEESVSHNCPEGAITTAIYSVEDLTSYVVHSWNYVERSEEAPRQLYSEHVDTVTLENGQVADTDSAVTIYLDTFHKSDWVRLNGNAFVRHNEGIWESISTSPDWNSMADGLMGKGPLFYENFKNVPWVGSGPKPEDSYCELSQVNLNGTSGWQMVFHNVPEWIFQAGFDGGSAYGYEEVQDRIRNGWTFQSADYTATLLDLYSSPRLVGESVRTKLGDGSGNVMYITLETQWSNFNEPVTIRKPEE